MKKKQVQRGPGGPDLWERSNAGKSVREVCAAHGLSEATLLRVEAQGTRGWRATTSRSCERFRGGERGAQADRGRPGAAPGRDGEAPQEKMGFGPRAQIGGRIPHERADLRPQELQDRWGSREGATASRPRRIATPRCGRRFARRGARTWATGWPTRSSGGSSLPLNVKRVHRVWKAGAARPGQAIPQEAHRAHGGPLLGEPPEPRVVPGLRVRLVPEWDEARRSSP